MKTRFLFSAFLTAACVPALALAKPMAPVHTTPRVRAQIAQILKTMGKTVRFGGVSVSPNGSTLAWTLHGKQGSELQLADSNGSHVRTVQIAGAGKKCGSGRPAWSPNGRQIAFLSNCGNKNHSQDDIFVASVRGAHPVAHRLTHLNGFVHDLSWSPDGRHLGILYVAGDLHRVIATSATKPRVGVIGENGVEHQRMNIVDLANGHVHALTPDSLFVYEYAWSPKADAVAFVAAAPPGRDNWWVAKLYTQSVAPGSRARVLVDPNTVKGPLHGLQIAVPSWSPNASRIAFIGGLMSDHGATGGDLYVVSANGGQPVNVTPSIHTSPSWLTWTGNNSLLVSAFASGKTRVSTFTLRGSRPARETRLFTGAYGPEDGTAVSALALSKRHERFAFVRSTFTQPPEIFTGRFNTDDGVPHGLDRAPHAITHANRGLKPIWSKAVSVEWHNEGFHVQGWLLFPLGYNPHKMYPMVVNVHGGPVWGVRPRWGSGAQLAALGYIVLMPNPRGSLGEGEAFTKAIRRNMGYGDLRDILVGVDKVEKKYPVDDKRLGITGWSYGGFMSMFAPTQTHRFRAAVAGAGLSDWLSYYGENSIDKWMIPFFGASVYEDPAAYAKSSAINFIKNDKTPTLVVVGQYDGECPAPQSFEFWHGLRAMGVPTKLVVYPGEGHGFHKMSDMINVMKRSANWFAKYLGDGAVGK